MQNDSNYPYMGPGVKPMRSWDEREKSQPTPLEEKIGKENIKDDGKIKTIDNWTKKV